MVLVSDESLCVCMDEHSEKLSFFFVDCERAVPQNDRSEVLDFIAVNFKSLTFFS